MHTENIYITFNCFVVIFWLVPMEDYPPILSIRHPCVNSYENHVVLDMDRYDNSI